MAITIDGLVSGLDVTSIVSQITALERRPVTILENKQATLADQKTAWQEVSTRLRSLESATAKLDTATEFASRSGLFSSNNASGGSVLSLSTSSTVSDGAYNIKVSQLAQAQKSASAETFSSTKTAAGISGTITLTSPSSGTPINISVVATDTLADIQSAITNSGANITATMVNTASTSSPAYKLLLTGDNKGAANDFTVATTLDAGALSFSTTQTAVDASLTIDGVSITKDSNTITDVINGATLNLETVGSGTLTFTTDYDGIISKVQDFVDSYNALTTYMAEQLRYDQTNNTRGVLFGNSTLMTIQNKVRSLVTNTVPGIDATNPNNLAALSQLGLLTNNENQLTLDSTALRDKLQSNFTDVQNVFTTSGSGTYTFVSSTGNSTGGTYDTKVVDLGGGIYGIALSSDGGSTYTNFTQSGDFAYGVAGTKYEDMIFQTGTLTAGEVGNTGSMRVAVGVAQSLSTITGKYTEYSTEGLIFNQNKSITDTDKEIQKQVDDLDRRITKKEKDLKAKFSSMEVLLAKLKSQQSYLSSQLSTFIKSYG